MLINLKKLLNETKGVDLNYVICSIEDEVCEPCIGLDELKMVLGIHKPTLEQFEKGRWNVFAFTSSKPSDELCDWFEGYFEACEAIRDFEDYVCDLEYQAIDNNKPLSQELQTWITEERFDLNDRLAGKRIRLERIIADLTSRE